MNRNQIKKEFQENFRELRKILNSWELIPGSPSDEFDSINHQILSHLYKGADFEKVSRVLDSELTVTYGLSTDLKDAEKITDEIMEWWNFKIKENFR
ncbi:hypothetical protein FNJ87_03205 [Nonlabens mediterrranea]|uniref:Uncharacterized protein n=1 Tax=Nonlabens mediterrranea TaxID=1419947 RepID=A0ABS0A222_9FLAO|nr:hypothetical protein [Nonlabens mediterrranea]